MILVLLIYYIFVFSLFEAMQLLFYFLIYKNYITIFEVYFVSLL